MKVTPICAWVIPEVSCFDTWRRNVLQRNRRSSRQVHCNNA